MAIISSEVKSSNGNLTIPVNCKGIVALVAGTTNPTIGGVAMTQECSNNVSISTKNSPSTGTVACTVGQSTRFVYLDENITTTDSQAGSEGALPFVLDSAPGALVFGQTGYGVDSGVLTIGGSPATYLDNYTRGYGSASAATVSCSGSSGAPSGTSYAFVSVLQGDDADDEAWIV